MSKEIVLEDLNSLQQAVNNWVKLWGIEDTIKYMNNVYKNSTLKASNVKQKKLIVDFIKLKSIEVFDLDESYFLTSIMPEYKQARMVCYHLIRKHTKTSYPKLAEYFQNDERSVTYFHNLCNEWLEIPQFYKEFVKNYELIDGLIIEFKGTFN